MKKKRPDGDVVLNVVDKNGLRTLKIMNSGEIDVDAWRKYIPFYSRELGEIQEKVWSESKLGVHYLELKWYVREPYFSQTGELPEGEKYDALLWCLGPAKRIRETLEEAVEAFLGYVGDLPKMLLVRSAKGIPERVIAWTDGFVLCEVDVVEAGWLPERFIVLRD
jgi:hypothetical protein